MATRHPAGRKDASLLGALRHSAAAGLVLGSLVVVALLVLGDTDVDVVVWGASLLLGIIGTATGLVFAGMTRLVGRGESHALGRDHVQGALPARGRGSRTIIPLRGRTAAGHRPAAQRLTPPAG